MYYQSKLKCKIRASLACGVMITAVALSGCSGSEKAVQANAPIISSGVMSTESNSSVSNVSSSASSMVSSDLTSHSTPQVSSAVATSSGVTSQKPATGSASTSHQAPVTSKPSVPSSGGTRTSSAKAVSQAPASKPAPVSKPAPASVAPAPKPVSTAPVEEGISAKYHGATYGCADKGQYDTVLSKAEAVKGSSGYNRTYDAFKGDEEGFKSATGVDYSEEWLDIISIRGYFGKSGTGDASYGSAYDYFTGANRMCADKAKALEAALHCAGYNARLAAGTYGGSGHMWCQVYMDGQWWNLDGVVTTAVPAGHTISSTGYNIS